MYKKKNVGRYTYSTAFNVRTEIRDPVVLYGPDRREDKKENDTSASEQNTDSRILYLIDSGSRDSQQNKKEKKDLGKLFDSIKRKKNYFVKEGKKEISRIGR